MIKLIGVQRIVAIVFLLAVNAAVGASWFFVMQPMQQQAQDNLNAVNAKINSLRLSIRNIKSELAQLKRDQGKYDALVNNGFFMQQDRFVIGKQLKTLRDQSGLMGFSYKVGDIRDIKDNDVAKAKYQLIDSQIDIDQVVSYTDINLFEFLQGLESNFPGHVRLDSFSVHRTGKIDKGMLKNIAEHKPVSLIDAKASFDWITMVPKSDDKKDAGKNGGFRGR